ncbi:lipopolysaccharide biosynthesis protein [Flammeovirga sp. SubArs3]|uniref:lipopolysaccharide biosynthesis protein n=1 Tax=Flammeovirga sp. SubArs3 TaxID=2995316 RepID=UPI00248CB7D8|nr:lipopolysaccharide biosynthesis protein [Flammeovirga sp. SubArs3]
MSSLKKQSTIAFAWDFIGKMTRQSVGFIISIFLARLLTPEDFGLLALVNVIISISISMMDMGLGVALIQRKEVTDKHYGSVFFFNVTIGILLAIILFISAPFVGNFYDNKELIIITKAMSPIFILQSFGNVIRMRLRKQLQYDIPTQGNIIAASISGIIGVTLAFSGYGVWSLVVQALLNPIFNNCYLFIRAKWRPKLIFSWKALKELWSFGLKMFFSSMLDTTFRQLDTLIIGKLFSEKILGFFFRARSLNQYVVEYSSSSIMSVMLPALSIIQDNEIRFKDTVSKTYHLVSFLAFFLSGLLFVTGDNLILFLFGEKWSPSIPIFRLLILTAYVYPLSAVLVNVLSAKGNSKDFFYLEIIKKVFFGVAFIFAFTEGLETYLKAYIIASALAVATNIFYASCEINVTQWWFYKRTLPYLVISIVIGGAIFSLKEYLGFNNFIDLLILGSSYSIFFIGISYLLKVKGLSFILNELNKLNIKKHLKR